MANDTIVLRAQTRERGGKGSVWWGATLPPELLARARHRISRVALLLTGVSSMAMVAAWLLPPIAFPRNQVSTPIIILHLASFFLPAGLFVVARSRLSHKVVLNLGLAFVVLLCLVISLAMPWFMFFNYGYVPQLTWTTLLIALYPLLVPSTVPRTAVAALSAVLTVPLGVFLLDHYGAVTVDPSLYAVVTIHPAIAAVIALLGSRVIYGLSLDVARARRIGSYHLEERLGAGGMGEVWRARHHLLARPAAIKLVRREMLGGAGPTGERAMQRFDREAQVTATLDSPHTIRLYDYGTTEDGNVYYVMELLDGLDLQTIVERFGPFPAERVVYVLFQICDSLAEAHNKGLVHRDVKPANVYLCRQAMWDDFVKVLDFGLVCVTAEDGRGARLTMEGLLGGTPAYMAPESVDESRSVDARTDLYAVGCVAYWLLTGETVFKRETTMSHMMAHLNDAPTPPSQITDRPIPAALEQTIMDCIAKRAEDRPQSAIALARRLQEVELDRPWTPERAADWWSTRLPTTQTAGRLTDAPLQDGVAKSVAQPAP